MGLQDYQLPFASSSPCSHAPRPSSVIPLSHIPLPASTTSLSLFHVTSRGVEGIVLVSPFFPFFLSSSFSLPPSRITFLSLSFFLMEASLNLPSLSLSIILYLATLVASLPISLPILFFPLPWAPFRPSLSVSFFFFTYLHSFRYSIPRKKIFPLLSTSSLSLFSSLVASFFTLIHCLVRNRFFFARFLLAFVSLPTVRSPPPHSSC